MPGRQSHIAAIAFAGAGRSDGASGSGIIAGSTGPLAANGPDSRLVAAPPRSHEPLEVLLDDLSGR